MKSDFGMESSLKRNLTGQFRFAKEAIPHLEKTGGSIINISSDAGLKTHQDFNADNTLPQKLL